MGKVVQMPLEYEKPSTAGLRLLLEKEGITPDQVVLVGDNCKKDIRIAQEMGIADVWARYGTVISPKARARLSYYSASSIQKRNVSQEGETPYHPTYIIDRFEDILPLLI
ncbi:MAG: HAD hydrolase-like protein [PVC group bacterium]